MDGVDQFEALFENAGEGRGCRKEIVYNLIENSDGSFQVGARVKILRAPKVALKQSSYAIDSSSIDQIMAIDDRIKPQ